MEHVWVLLMVHLAEVVMIDFEFLWQNEFQRSKTLQLCIRHATLHFLRIRLYLHVFRRMQLLSFYNYRL